MTILSRCSDIVVANINALLDRVEDPEAMITQIIRDMEDSLAAARGHAAKAIAVERWLLRELTRERAEIEQWQTKARTAVAANHDDLARQALTRKKELEMSVAELAIQHTASLEASAQARAALGTLEANLAAARRKQRSLIARRRAALAQRELCRAAGKRLGADVTLASRLQRWETRMTDLEDEIAAATEVQGLAGTEARIAQCEIDAEIDRELNALKVEAAQTAR
jgi:phage shock protein A